MSASTEKEKALSLDKEKNALSSLALTSQSLKTGEELAKLVLASTTAAPVEKKAARTFLIDCVLLERTAKNLSQIFHETTGEGKTDWGSVLESRRIAFRRCAKQVIFSFRERMNDSYYRDLFTEEAAEPSPTETADRNLRLNPNE